MNTNHTISTKENAKTIPQKNFQKAQSALKNTRLSTSTNNRLLPEP